VVSDVPRSTLVVYSSTDWNAPPQRLDAVARCITAINAKQLLYGT
jgi:hypothetical protein